MPDWTESFKNQLLAYVDNILKQQVLKRRVSDWLEKMQQEYVEDEFQADIDFQGLQEYLSVGIQDDVKRYFCGTLEEQHAARRMILAKARDAAHAADPRSCEKVEHITDSVLDIIHQYAWEQMGEKDGFIFGEYSRITEKAVIYAMRQFQFPEQAARFQSVPEHRRTVGLYKKPRRSAHYIESGCNTAILEHLEYQNRLLILGMPGIGKTEGVLWYLDQAKYDSVIWLNFETFEQSIKSVGDFLKRITGAVEKWEGDKETVLSDMIQLLAERLKEYENAVVIFDSVNHKELLKMLSEVEFPCPVMITSWLNYHYGYFHSTEVLQWQGLDMEKSEKLFLDMTGMMESEINRRDIQELLQLCDGIPLVLRQAAAYIMESRISIEQYTELCRKTAALKFDQTGQQDLRISRKNANVCATFYLPYQALREECGEDAGFIHLFSSICCLDPEGIEEGLLLKIAGLPFEHFNDGLGRILRYSLIERKNGKVSMKQVVQDILFSFLDDTEKLWVVEQTGQVLAEEFLKLPLLTSSLECYTELGHNGVRFLSITEHNDLVVRKLPELLLGIGSSYYLQGFFSLAQRYLRQALDMCDKNMDWQLRFRILSVLGEVYEEAGDNETAMKYIDEYRQDRERMLETEPLVVVQGLIAEANVYEDLSCYEKGLELIDQALKIVRETEGEFASGYYLSANTCKMNIFNRLKQYDRSVQVFESVGDEFHFSKKQMPENILAVKLYGSMVNSLLCRGQVRDALDCYQSQLAFYKKYYKNEYHPSIAYACGNIAIAYMEMSEYEEAAQWLERSKEILLRSAPSHHEMFLQTYYRYAEVRYRLGDYEMAWDLFRQALYENQFILDVERQKRLEINAGILMACTQYGRRNWDRAMEILEDVYAKEIEAGVQQSVAAEVIRNHEFLKEKVMAGNKIEDTVL